MTSRDIVITIIDDSPIDTIITVPADTKPIWHGAYQAGRLTLYVATQEPQSTDVYLVYIVTDKYNLELDFMGYTCHTNCTDPGKLINECMQYIEEQVASRALAERDEGVENGSIRLQ